MSTKHSPPRKTARKPAYKKRTAERPMSERAMRAAFRKLVFETPPIPSYPAAIPPAPARWVPVREGGQWLREFARAAARRAGKPARRSRVPRTMTLRAFAEREWPKLNTICLDDGMSLVRLIGVSEDEYDLYYIVQHPGGRRRYVSAVCRCDSLRGALRVYLYQHLERMFNLNGCRPVRRMLILREVYGEKINMNGKQLLEEMRAVAHGERQAPAKPGSQRRSRTKRN